MKGDWTARNVEGVEVSCGSYKTPKPGQFPMCVVRGYRTMKWLPPPMYVVYFAMADGVKLDRNELRKAALSIKEMYPGKCDEENWFG